MSAPLKGRITLVSTGEFVPFMFNPTEISTTRSVPYPVAGVPGVSHPVPQYTGGGEQPVSFDLWLDGERGASIRGRRAVNRLRPTTQGRDISIQSELDWYEGLTLGERSQGSFYASAAPSVVLLTYGTMFRGTPCIVREVSVRANWFRPDDMAPIRAVVSLKMATAYRAGRNRSDVFVGV